jgi:hypothetical protein
MKHTIFSLLLIALLHVTYSSAIDSWESEQHPWPSPPVSALHLWVSEEYPYPTPSVPLSFQSTPSPVPISEHPRDPNPPGALTCFIGQLQHATNRCAANDCLRGGGRCLPNRTGRRCSQHVVHSGEAFPNSVLRSWLSWSSTKDSCRGCGCMNTPKRRRPKMREIPQRDDSEESHTSDRIMLFGVDLSKQV